MRLAASFLALVFLVACQPQRRDLGAGSETQVTTANGSQPTGRVGLIWQVRRLTVAPNRFRPGGWTNEFTLWGLVRGRVTRLDTRTGAVSTLPQNGWSFFNGRGVASWRNEKGTWMVRDRGRPILLAGLEPDPGSGFDGPPTVLWSPDGSRALLAWRGEWDFSYRLLQRDGSTRKLDVAIPGYFENDAVLWLDSARVLFRTVANGPTGSQPTHRESGRNGALAVLDLTTGAYAVVARARDSTALLVAGRYFNDVLVTEWTSGSVLGHWFYDPLSWQRRPAPVPSGRAFSSPAGAVVVLLNTSADSANAVLVSGSDTTDLGRVSRDTEPAFSPSGRRGALRTDRGVVIFEGG
jgi:hypothetical protein